MKSTKLRIQGVKYSSNQVLKYLSIQVFKFICLQFNKMVVNQPTNNVKARDPVGSKNLELDNRGDRRSRLKRNRNAAVDERNNSHNDNDCLDNVVAQGSKSPRDEKKGK